ncbi:MAG: RluA family pseudouridine synthase [Desulfuromonas sp.]|nr:MAG: RluA family pseudouridine synthase [Desulfuromonas sp.]
MVISSDRQASTESVSVAPISGVWRLRAESEDRGERLDRFLAQKLPQLSRGQWRKVIDIGGVHFNGRRTRRCGSVVNVGDRIEAYIDGRELEPYRVSDQDIIYLDRHLIALNKPYGVEMQPTHARYIGTLYEAMLTWMRERSKNPRSEPSLGMVQRLDRDTSGLLVFSIHPQAHRGLTTAFTSRKARKVYLALIAGELQGEGEYRSMLARSRKGNLVKSVPAGGKEAITRYRVLASSQGCSLVQVEPLTGRSHQIRVHFSEAGYPLIGDLRYGGPREIDGQTVLRQQLHAWKLAIAHPVTGAPMEFVASLPVDMEQLLAHFNWEMNSFQKTDASIDGLVK